MVVANLQKKITNRDTMYWLGSFIGNFVKCMTSLIVTENEKFKILWDFTIQTDHEIHHGRPDRTLHENKNNKVGTNHGHCGAWRQQR